MEIFSAIANQESLSSLETEMRKLEALVKEVVDDMNYMKLREARFTETNSACIWLVSSKPTHISPSSLN